MIIDGRWVDADEWLIDKLNQIKVVYDEINQKISEGELTENEARNALRYIRDLEWIGKSPEEYWQSSSYYC